MMADEITNILARCLTAVEQGEMTIEECLAQYPRYRDELTDLLQVASVIETAPAVSPSSTFRRIARVRLLNQLPDHPQPLTFQERLLSIGQVSRQKRTPRFAVSWILIIAVLAIILGSSSVVYASAKALPGDAIYPIKIKLEDFRLVMADNEYDILLHLNFAENRLVEIESLLIEKRYDDIPLAVEGYKRVMTELNKAQLKVKYFDPIDPQTSAIHLQVQLKEQEQTLIHLQKQIPELVQASDAINQAIKALDSVKLDLPPDSNQQPDVIIIPQYEDVPQNYTQTPEIHVSPEIKKQDFIIITPKDS